MIQEIDDQYFCILPWISIHIWPSGKAYPCCMMDDIRIGLYGNVNESTVHELWNSDTAKQIRKDMMAGIPVKACSKCYDLEKNANTVTLRKEVNRKFKDRFFHKVVGTTDGYDPHPQMVYMDIRFSNLCNMKCRTCSPEFSSKWYDDFVADNTPLDLPKYRTIIDDHSQHLWNEIISMMDNVEEVYWAGGEPLITDEHYRILKHWIATGRSKHITMYYTTNFSRMKYKDENIFDLWKNFKLVKLSASLDASGERAEYIRHGTSWNNIVKNAEYLRDTENNIEFEITPTISVFNVDHFPDFHMEWIENGLVMPYAVRINPLYNPSWYSVQVLSRKHKEYITEKWIRYVQYVCSYATTEYENMYVDWKRTAQGMLNYMNDKDNIELIPKFKEEVSRWDVIRNENWMNTFPELSYIYEFDKG